MRQSEDQLQMAVVEWLEWAKPDCVWFHVPNQGNFPVQYRRKLAKMGLTPGVADMCFVGKDDPHSRKGEEYPMVGFIEFKVDGQTQSKAQEAFEAAVLAVGCDYRIARSLEDVQAILARWGLVSNPEQAARTAGAV